MDFGQQHVVLVHTGVAGQDFSQLSHIRRLIHAHADFDLSWLLRRVENVHEEIYLTMILRDRHRDAQKRVEGVRLPMTPRTSQTRPELRLEHGVHEGVVAPHVIRQSLGCNNIIRPTECVLQTENRPVLH